MTRKSQSSKSQNSIEARFQPMGLNLHVTSNSPAIIEAAEESFGRFGPAPAAAAATFKFELFEHEVDDGQPGEPVFRMAESLAYQSTGRDSTLVVDLHRGVAFGHFSATTLAHRPFFRWHFLELAFFILLEAQGLMMGVHGAALAKNGKAILLRAPSGGGKTTLAYAAARSRFQALAEDVVWLDKQRDVWWGMPWSFHLLPDAKAHFPELSTYSPVLQTNGEMKLEVNLENIRPGSTTTCAKPGAVVLMERLPGGQSRLEPIDPAAAKNTWPAGRTGLEMKLPHHRQLVDNLLAANTYRLYFGDDIESALNLLEPLLA